MLNTVYGGRTDHLGTCLKNLANAWRFANVTGAEFIAWWPKSRLGRDDMSLDALYSRLPFRVVDTLPPVDLKLTSNMGKRRLETASFSGLSTLHYGISGTAALVGENRNAIREQAREMMKSLEIRPEIQEAVDKIVTATGISSKTAVHIRRGDIVSHLKSPSPNGHPISVYLSWFVSRFAEVDAYADAVGHSSIVAFSDSRQALSCIAEKLPGQVVSISDCAEFTSRLSPHQIDLVEMLVMAHARIIIGPASNFSGFAALYGGKPFQDVRRYIKPRRLARELNSLFDTDTVNQVVFAYRPYFLRQRREKAWNRLSMAVTAK